uniref:fibrinogen alpha chain-like n=1 Tax=Solea senegalensis TaxID=28829 RepID=UPI001CD8DBE0|nr:fibrinogen alpha chain-like [Solea senegalensis]
MMTGAHGLPSHSTDTDVAHSHQHPYPDADAGFKTTSGPTTTPTIGTLGVPRQQRTSATTRFTSTTSPSVRTRFQGRVSLTVATTTTSTPRENFHTTTMSGVTVHSHWTTKNTKTGGKPRPAQGPNPAEKHKHGIKPEAIHKLKNPKNDHKQDRAPLPDKTDQKLKPSLQKPTTDQKLKPVKGQQAHNPKPEQRVTLNHLTTDQNLKNNPMLKHDKDLTTDKKPKYHQKSVPPVQRPTSYQRLATVYATGSDTNPQTEPNSKPERNQNNPLLTVKPDPKQKPQKNVKGKEKTKPDLRADYTTVQQPDSGSIGKAKLTLKPNNRSTTELMRNSRDNPSPESDSNQVKTPGQKLALDGINTPSDQKPKPSQKIPAINRDPKPGHIPKLNQKRLEIDPSKSTKPNVKPKTSQAPQKNQGLKTPGPSQTPDLYPKSVPDQIPKAQSNKTSKPRPPPRRGHTFKPGATSVQRPQPAVQQKSNPNTKTDSNPEISGTTADGIQNSQINMPPTSGSVKQSTEMTHSPGDAEFSPSTKESITPSPKTFNSLDTFPLLHALAEGSTVNPNSRAASDLGPQTAGQHSSIPMTTRPNKMIHGTLPSVIPSTSPGSTTLKSITEPALQAELPHHVAETAPEQTLHADNVLVPVPSPRAETTITLSPDTRSTTADTAGPKVPALESSTPSARELRVKINQVAAFSRDSQTSDAWSVDKRPTTEHPEDRGTDLKVKWIPSKVSTALRRDCSDHLLQGGTKSGVYLVTPDIRSKSFSVFCDMELGGGGWTLVQLRQDGSVSFNRTWAEYRSGFGEVGGREFWLGNNMIHLLTRDRDMVLRVELEDFEGLMEYAEYEQFKVASERLRYRLTVGGYSGTAGNALRFSKMYDHNSRAFTTPDRDNDRYPSGNCGAYYSSGWWFDACMAANLNGRYYVGKYKGIRDGIFWGTWHNISSEYYPTNDRQSFKTVRMMIRPKGFAP